MIDQDVKLLGSIQDFSRPEACSYLQAGQEFDGTQRVSHAPANMSEDWGVRVQIEVCWHCSSASAGSNPLLKLLKACPFTCRR